jgi:hypothetical protein
VFYIFSSNNQGRQEMMAGMVQVGSMSVVALPLGSWLSLGSKARSDASRRLPPGLRFKKQTF